LTWIKAIEGRKGLVARISSPLSLEGLGNQSASEHCPDVELNTLPQEQRGGLPVVEQAPNRPRHRWNRRVLLAGLSLMVAGGAVIGWLSVRMALGVPIACSIPLFMLGVVIYLFFATAIGVFLGTVARSMPQLGLLFILVFLPMNMLSGSNTPLESMPRWLATVMQASPSTHFVSFAQAILYRGADFMVVWPQFAIVAAIGGVFLGLALLRFRRVSGGA
jgi:ABC-type multidrug transport system permease subunit